MESGPVIFGCGELCGELCARSGGRRDADYGEASAGAAVCFAAGLVASRSRLGIATEGVAADQHVLTRAVLNASKRSV
jgi:hypothetical protein